MYLDIRNGTHIIIDLLPQCHIFCASAGLVNPVPNGSSTGDFPHFDDIYHITEGFLPFTQIEPTYDSTTHVSEVQDIVVASDNKSASQTWVVRDKTTAELAADIAGEWGNIRSKRDGLLTATDWTQLSDSTCASTYTNYRTALRNIPQTYTTPSSVVWPVCPV